MLWKKNPYTGKPIAKERVIVWTQEQTPHSRNGEWHPQSYPSSHLERGSKDLIKHVVPNRLNIWKRYAFIKI